MSIFFVDKLPTTYSNDIFYIESVLLGGNIVLEKTSPETGHYRVWVEDFVLNCENAYVQARFKESIYTQWHGKRASEAPLFVEYLELMREKHITAIEMGLAILFGGKDALPKPKKKARKRRTDHSGTDSGALVIYEDDSETGILPFSVRTDMTSEEYIDLVNEIGADVFGMGTSHMSHIIHLREAMGEYHKLPEVNQVVTIRSWGSWQIIHFNFNIDDEYCVVLQELEGSRTIMVPVTELTLTSAGLWVRESLGSVENVWDVIEWVTEKGLYLGTSLVAWLSKTKLAQVGYWAGLKLGFGQTNIDLHGGLFPMVTVLPISTQQTINAALMAGITLVPVAIGGVWENVVGQWFFPYGTVIVSNPDLPRDDWIYYDPISKLNTNILSQKSTFAKTIEFLHDKYAEGKNTVSETVGTMVNTVSSTVTKVFYGVCIIGGITVMYKIVS